MSKLRIPVAGSPMSRDTNIGSGYSKDQVFVNCYPEIADNPATRRRAIFLSKRPGYAKGNALASASAACEAGAIMVWSGSANSTPPVAAAFTFSGGVSVYNLVSQSQIGATISGVSDCTALTETRVGTTAYIVGNFFDSGSGVLEQWYYPEGGSWTQITDSDFPDATTGGIIGSPAHMDGFVFNMTTSGRVWNSDINTVADYTATGFVEAIAYPDKGVTVAKLNNYIVAFGEKSTEFFVNTGNPTGSPLTRVQGGALLMGAARTVENSTSGQYKPSVINAHGALFVIGTNSEAAVTGIYKFNGTSPEKVSNQTIDKMLAAGGINGFIGSLVLHGMKNVVVSGTSGTWCYCLDTGFWWKLELASGEIVACTSVNEFIRPPLARNYFTTDANARQNIMASTAVSQDDGSNFTMTVRTGQMDMETHKRKFWKSIALVGDTQSASAAVGVSYSDDDYGSFSTARNIDMSATERRLWRLGSSRRRAWQLTNTSNTPMRIEAMEIEYEEGQH